MVTSEQLKLIIYDAIRSDGYNIDMDRFSRVWKMVEDTGAVNKFIEAKYPTSPSPEPPAPKRKRKARVAAEEYDEGFEIKDIEVPEPFIPSVPTQTIVNDDEDETSLRRDILCGGLNISTSKNKAKELDTEESEYSWSGPTVNKNGIYGALSGIDRKIQNAPLEGLVAGDSYFSNYGENIRIYIGTTDDQLNKWKASSEPTHFLGINSDGYLIFGSTERNVRSAIFPNWLNYVISSLEFTRPLNISVISPTDDNHTASIMVDDGVGNYIIIAASESDVVPFINDIDELRTYFKKFFKDSSLADWLGGGLSQSAVNELRLKAVMDEVEDLLPESVLEQRKRLVADYIPDELELPTDDKVEDQFELPATVTVTDDPIMNNRLALELIKKGPGKFDRELVNRLYNGFGVEVKGTEGIFGLNEKRKKNLQQFYTTPEICELAVNMLNIPMNASVYDPTCGHGRFFYYVPNQSLCHGVEYEPLAHKVATAMYPDATIILDNTVNHVWDNEFDYILGNPPFSITLEDVRRQLKFTGYANKIISHIATFEITIRSVKMDGLVVIILPSKTFASFEKYEDFKSWFKQNTSVLAEIQLPGGGKTCKGTDWGMNLYIFKKSNNPYRNRYVDDDEVFKATVKSFDDISRVLAEWKETTYYQEDVLSYSESRDTKTPTTIQPFDATQYKMSRLIGTSKEVMSTDSVTLDIGGEIDYNSFQRDPMSVVPNGVVAELKIANLSTKYYPPKWSESRKQNIDIFEDRVLRFDNIVDGKTAFDQHPLMDKLQVFDCGYNLTDELRDAIVKKAQFFAFQNTPFEQWIDSQQSSDWSYLHAEDGIQARYKTLFDQKMAELEEMAKDPQYGFTDSRGRTVHLIGDLFYYNKVDAVRLALKASVIDASMMGTGKTRKALVAVLLKGFDHNLIICPSKLVPRWEEEFEILGMEKPLVLNTLDDVKKIPSHKFSLIGLTKCRTALDKVIQQHQTKDKKKKTPRKNPVYNADRVSSTTAENEAWEELGFDLSPYAPRANPSMAQQREIETTAKAAELTKRMFFTDVFKNMFGCVVIDEAHELSNPTTAQTESVRRLRPSHWLMLTGTPIKNRVRGLFSLLDIGWKAGSSAFPYYQQQFIDDFVMIHEFDEAYTDSMGYRKSRTKEVELPSIKNPDQLIALMESKWLRRTKYEPDVQNSLQELGMQFVPPKITIEKTQLSEAEREYTNVWMNEFERIWEAAQTARGEGSDAENAQKLILPMITKLRQVAVAPQADLLDEEATASLRGIVDIDYKGGTTPRQEKMINDIVRRYHNGEKVFCITTFLGVNYTLANMLEQKGLKAEIFDGSINIRKRMDMLDDFKDGKIDVLLATIKTMDTGLNIPEADACIILNPDWNYSDMEQAWSRMLRPKSKGEKEVIIYVNEGTIEDYVWQLAEMKSWNVNTVLDYIEGGEEPEWHSWKDAINAMIEDRKTAQMASSTAESGGD